MLHMKCFLSLRIVPVPLQVLHGILWLSYQNPAPAWAFADIYPSQEHAPPPQRYFIVDHLSMGCMVRVGFLPRELGRTARLRWAIV